MVRPCWKRAPLLMTSGFDTFLTLALPWLPFLNPTIRRPPTHGLARSNRLFGRVDRYDVYAWWGVDANAHLSEGSHCRYGGSISVSELLCLSNVCYLYLLVRCQCKDNGAISCRSLVSHPSQVKCGRKYLNPLFRVYPVSSPSATRDIKLARRFLLKIMASHTLISP